MSSASRTVNRTAVTTIISGSTARIFDVRDTDHQLLAYISWTVFYHYHKVFFPTGQSCQGNGVRSCLNFRSLSGSINCRDLLACIYHFIIAVSLFTGLIDYRCLVCRNAAGTDLFKDRGCLISQSECQVYILSGTVFCCYLYPDLRLFFSTGKYNLPERMSLIGSCLKNGFVFLDGTAQNPGHCIDFYASMGIRCFCPYIQALPFITINCSVMVFSFLKGRLQLLYALSIMICTGNIQIFKICIRTHQGFQGKTVTCHLQVSSDCLCQCFIAFSGNFNFIYISF